MSLVAHLLAALTIVAPQDGATVPTLRPGQKAYFTGARAERFVRMDNAADRKKLFGMGATQQPLRLAWTGGEANAVYLLDILRVGGDEQTFAVSNRTEVWLTNLELGGRYRWTVRQAGTLDSASASFFTEDVAPRLLRADGVRNFRDLGGWRTTDGKRVRENMIFRSAGLRASSKTSADFFRRKVEAGERRVTDEGVGTLKEDFKVRTDLELRPAEETSGMVGSALGKGVRWKNVPFGAYASAGDPKLGREAFAEIFRLFAKKENYPVLMQCSNGCDRTGTLAFLLNGLLGVSEDDLCRDWEASLFCDPDMKVASSRVQGLVAFLKTMPGDAMKGRVEAYARSCGITDAEIAAFRAIMLR